MFGATQDLTSTPASLCSRSILSTIGDAVNDNKDDWVAHELFVGVGLSPQLPPTQILYAIVMLVVVTASMATMQSQVMLCQADQDPLPQVTELALDLVARA